MIIFERLGGWGLANTLFQIATTVSLAKLNNTDYGFPSDCYFRFARYNPNALGRIFFKKELPWVDINLIKNQDFERWGFGGVGFKTLPTTYKNMIIDGFFQSEKYFIQHRDYILELFEIKDEYKLYIQSKYKHLIDEDACSLHVRRGDYANARELYRNWESSRNSDLIRARLERAERIYDTGARDRIRAYMAQMREGTLL